MPQCCIVFVRSRSIHSWFPRHCPPATPSSQFTRPPPPPTNASSHCGESTSTSLSSPEPTSLNAVDEFGVGRRQQTVEARRPNHDRYRNIASVGSAFRSGSSTSSVLAAKRSKMHHPHQHSHQAAAAQLQAHHVKKPLNAFMLFMKEMRSKVIDECTLKESAAINQILGRKVSLVCRVRVMGPTSFGRSFRFICSE